MGKGRSRPPVWGLKGPVGRGFEKARVVAREFGIQFYVKAAKGEIFDEKYRVVAVESQSLTIRGVRSGKVLTIMNPNPESPLTPAEYPPGKLIKLSDPGASPRN